ncbi:MAG TPA: fumarate reductase subunit C [Nocardioidaceae bacterium]
MSELRTYRWQVKTFWWVKKWTYFLFVMRELSSIFVAWFVLYLLILIAAVNRGDAAYEDFKDFASNPAIVVLNLVAFAFVVLHVITWFSLTPKAMDVRLGDRPVPSWAVVASQYAALVVVSAVILWLVTG